MKIRSASIPTRRMPGLILVAWVMACNHSNSNEAAADARASEADAAAACPALVPAVDATCLGPAAVTDSSAARAPDDLPKLGCLADFQMLASDPVDSTLPGARSVKVVLDTQNGNRLYFQNSSRYPIHYDFVTSQGLVSQSQSDFNSNYYVPYRRFVLGAVSYYEQPGVWALEFAPYDSASAELMAMLFRAVKNAAFFGDSLLLHPTSDAVEAEAQNLGQGVPLVPTDCLFKGIDYQPLNLATGIGTLRIIKVSELDTTALTPFDIIVLDQAPNDIPVVQGLITEQFQTPLSHINVLARNRCTPNMGLRNAMTNPKLTRLAGKLVKLVVNAQQWDVTEEVSQSEADAYWAAKKPEKVRLPQVDEGKTGLFDIERITEETGTDPRDLVDVIGKSVAAFGGKAAQYSIVAKTNMNGGILVAGETPVPTRKAFAIPVYYYLKFMRDHGFFDRVRAWQTDPSFTANASHRDQALAKLRDDIMAAPLDSELLVLVMAKIDNEFKGLRMRFRTSTNSEDLAAFPCAGCYESHSGDAGDVNSIADAIRKAYSSAWIYRTYEERSYYGVDHESVGMALLVHPTFVDEDANGVAVTANPYDPTSSDVPAYYINVQLGGDVEVVHPVSGVSSDTFLFYPSTQSVVQQSHSSLIPAGQTVLTREQTTALGTALKAIHSRFSFAYGPSARVANTGWYAMDVEFKFVDRQPVIKQARPYPSGTESSTCRTVTADAGTQAAPDAGTQAAPDAGTQAAPDASVRGEDVSTEPRTADASSVIDP